MTLLSLSPRAVTIEAPAKHSAQIFHASCMMLLRSIEIQGHRLVKQENYSAKRKTGLLVETFLYARSTLAYLPKSRLVICVLTRLWRLNFRVIRQSASAPS